METPRHTLPRQQRLKSRTAINLLFGEGKRGYVFPIRFLYRIEKLNPGNVDSSTEDTLLNTEFLSEKDATSQDTVNAEDFTIGTRNESQESTLAIETGQATISVKGSDRVIEGEQNCEMVTSPTDQPAADKSLNGTDIEFSRAFEFEEFLLDVRPGDQFDITVVRSGGLFTFTITASNSSFSQVN